MDDHNYLELSEKFAREVHKGQMRRGGDLEYITHPEAVAKRCKLETSKCIAWMHDVIEDADYQNGVVSVLVMKFPRDIQRGVSLLTREQNQTYFDYIMELKDAPLEVLCVKIADLEHNMSDLDECSLKDKYRFAHQMLWSLHDKIVWDRVLYTTEELNNG